MTRVRRFVPVVALAFALFAGSADAAISYFTDRTSFTTAVSGSAVLNEDFDDTTLIPGLSIATSTGSIGGGLFNDRLVPGGTTTTFSYGGALSGFGGDFDLAGPGGSGTGLGLTITLLLGGSQILSQEIPNSISGTFWGFVSTDLFDSVIFAAGTQPGAAETYSLDNLALAAVPLPGALWLLGSGLAFLGALHRRRKSVAT